MNNEKLNLSYHLDDSMRISIQYKNEESTITLNYKPQNKEWDSRKSFLKEDSKYYYSLLAFKNNLQSQFKEGQGNISSFKKLIKEVDSVLQGKIENIQMYNFDYTNKESGAPKYQEFIKAFEKYSKLNKSQYEVEAFEHTILFKTKDETFEMSTWQTLTSYLRSYIDNESYEEIYTQTDSDIWGAIYVDAGIPKTKFIPRMQHVWERYWDRCYKEVMESVGRKDHLDEEKEKSWRTFSSFIVLYDDAGDIIELAYEFDEMVLYPIAVITMMNIFDAEICYDEYCEEEFSVTNNWESIDLDEDDDYGSVFHIRPYEF